MLRAALGGLSIAVTIALAAACSDDPEKSAAEVASEENARALCDRLFSCCTQTELNALAFVDAKKPPTHDGCVAYHIAFAHDYVVATDTEAAAGRIALHVDESPGCAEAVRTMACSEFHARLRRIHVGDAYALCNVNVVEPKVENGQPCRYYMDCVGGFCDLPPGTNAAADAGPDPLGKCKPLPKGNEPCSADGCAAGFRCDPNAGTCVAYVAAGGACDADDACTSSACRDGICVSPGRCGG